MSYKKKERIKLALVLLLFSIILFSISFNSFSIVDDEIKQKQEIRPSQSNDFDILEFWEKEIKRVENTDLNVKYGDEEKLEYINPSTKIEYEFKQQEIYFDSPNWINAKNETIRLHGYLLSPENVKSINPGCLAMHGLNNIAEEVFKLAYPYLEKGFIILVYDHPGHGQSEGPPPSPELFYYEKDYNNSAHFYLTLCGAIQALRLLENLESVDNSKIMVTGISYGALNTMWLSGICGDRIQASLPWIAVGDVESNLEDPTELIFWLFGKNAETLKDDENFWNNINLRFDPIYYLKSEKLPPIFWQVGTTDDYFYYRGITGTYDSVQHDKAYLQIHPNGHHGLINFENATSYWIDYIVNGGSAPPKIDLKPLQKESSLLGTTFKFNVEVDCLEDVESVQICYRYIDILGAKWEIIDLEKSDNDEWTGGLNPGIVSSRVDYYVIVNLKGDDNTWFSSKIFEGGVIESNTTAIFYIALVSFIAIPAILLFRRRFIKNVKEVEPDIRLEAKKYFIVECVLLSVAEIAFFVSLILPFAVFESGDIIWTHIYVFNKLYTYDVLFLFLTGYLTAMFLIGWIIYAHLSIMKPLISGFFQVLYPFFVLLIFAAFATMFVSNDPSNSTNNFGMVYPGFGVYLMLIASLSLFVIGIWKRKYQAKLGIRVPKNKWYNIDRWFKIKSVEEVKKESKT